MPKDLQGEQQPKGLNGCLSLTLHLLGLQHPVPALAQGSASCSNLLGAPTLDGAPYPLPCGLWKVNLCIKAPETWQLTFLGPTYQSKSCFEVDLGSLLAPPNLSLLTHQPGGPRLWVMRTHQAALILLIQHARCLREHQVHSHTTSPSKSSDASASVCRPSMQHKVCC